MAYHIDALGVCSVSIRAFLHGQRVQNTFYYMFTAGPPITDGAAALFDINGALDVAGDLYSSWRDCVSANVVNITADLQWIAPQRYIKRTFIVGPEGNRGGTSFTNTSAVLTLRASEADRRSLAHKHLPGLPMADVGNGLLSADLRDTMTDFAAVASSAVTFGTRVVSPIVYGRARPAYTDRHGVLHPAIPESKRLIDTWLVGDTARTMRRRTVGVGE